MLKKAEVHGAYLIHELYAMLAAFCMGRGHHASLFKLVASSTMSSICATDLTVASFAASANCSSPLSVDIVLCQGKDSNIVDSWTSCVQEPNGP